MSSKHVDDIRFRYEIAGESVQDICLSCNIYKAELEAVIEEEEWEVLEAPGLGADEETVNKYYKQSRQALSIQRTRRSLKLYPTLMDLEDRLIKVISEAIKKQEDSKSSDPEEVSKNISRLVASYTKLIDQQTLFQEAIKVPSLADGKAEDMLKRLVDEKIKELL